MPHRKAEKALKNVPSALSPDERGGAFGGAKQSDNRAHQCRHKARMPIKKQFVHHPFLQNLDARCDLATGLNRDTLCDWPLPAFPATLHEVGMCQAMALLTGVISIIYYIDSFNREASAKLIGLYEQAFSLDNSYERDSCCLVHHRKNH
jgi:hypothetical protein